MTLASPGRNRSLEPLFCDVQQVSYVNSRMACLTTADDCILPTEDAAAHPSPLSYQPYRFACLTTADDFILPTEDATA